jgi:hypothetical protein
LAAKLTSCTRKFRGVLNEFRALLLPFLPGLVWPATVLHAEDQVSLRSEVELTNFAFANYLGTGFYSSSNIDVFIVKIPFSSTLKQVTEKREGLIFNYPLTLGVTNIDDDFEGIGNVPGLNDVGTVSVVPGLEYVFPVLNNWQIAPFLDLGIARDVSNEVNIRVRGAGVKSYVTFDFDSSWFIFANRLLYADQKNLDSGNESSFAVFETALEYTVPTSYTIEGSAVSVGYYLINYHYLDDLVLVDSLDDRISLQDKNEIGITFTLPKHSWLPDNFEFGFGVQVTKDTELYRLVIGAPFF